MKIQRTKMLNRYIIKFIVRVGIFVGTLLLYIWDKPRICDLMIQPVYLGISPIHVLWFVFMSLMILHLFPMDILSMALRKEQKKQYWEEKNYSEIKLMKFVKEQNVRAWMVMLVWLSLNAVIGFLYLFQVLDEADLFMCTVFFFLCDYICILLFCPFQTFIMKNKCCVNCRIYDWGHFMMFTPMLFIRNFFSWSLFFTSLIVLIHWEIIYAKHPERFWNGSNKTIQCTNCKDKTCQFKNLIRKV